MLNINKIAITATLCCFTVGAALAQSTVKSGYFLPGMLNRHKLNPALINDYGYVGIPVISDLSIGAATNMGAGKLFFPMQDGTLTTFMSPTVSPEQFLSGLSPMNNANANISMDILSGGFHAGGAYHTLALGLRSQTSLYVPYAMFDFIKSGMTSPDVTSYNIKNLSAHTTNYIDLSYSYARKIGDEWSVGAKLKFLVGLADVRANISNMNISMSQDEWLVRSQGHLDAAGPGETTFTSGSDGALDGFSLNNYAPAGYGGGIDLGATYRTPVEGLTVSIAVTDLGFISWSKSAKAATDGDPFIFDGFSDIPVGGVGTSVDSQIEELKNGLIDLFKFYPTEGSSPRTTMLRPTLNIGVEYELVPEIFSFGLLSSTRFDEAFVLSELILSANYRPRSWFNASVTADWSNVAFSCGAVVNFCPRFINFFVGVDFFLFNVTPQFIPMKSAAPLVNLGLNVPIVHRDKYYKNRR